MNHSTFRISQKQLLDIERGSFSKIILDVYRFIEKHHKNQVLENIKGPYFDSDQDEAILILEFSRGSK